MKNVLVLLVVLFITKIGFTQYSYSRGYEKGFESGCNCYDRIPNGNYLYTIGSYNQGYLDGKIDGAIYANNNGKSPNSSYGQPYDYNSQYNLYKPDYELLERSLYTRQSRFNSNYEMVDNKMESIEQTLNNLSAQQSKYQIAIRMPRIYLIEKEFKNKVNELYYMNIDYSSGTTTQQVLNILDVYSKQLTNLINEIKLDAEQTLFRLNQIKNIYNSFDNKNVRVLDGWHDVYVSNNRDFCASRKVYVSNNKITKYVAEGNKYLEADYSMIEYSNEIKNGKTTIKLRPNPHFFDVYFLNVLSSPGNIDSAPSATGTVSFWSDNPKGKIEIFVEDHFVGVIESYFSSGTPNCKQNGTVSFTNQPGTYKYLAISVDNTKRWEGTITIKSNQCSTLKLKK